MRGMMGRKSNRAAPFEVMGDYRKRQLAQGRERGQDAGQGEATAKPAAGAGQGGPGSRVGQWATAAATPMVLRVPRGLAVAALAGVIGLLVLAYWVGYVQGGAGGERTSSVASADGLKPPPPEALRGMGQDGRDTTAGLNGQAGQARPSRDGATRQSPAGPPSGSDQPAADRQPGLNYFIVATWPREAARSLAAFIQQQGLATSLVSRDNGRFAVVITEPAFALEPEDTADASPVRRQREQQLADVLEAWNAQEDLPGGYNVDPEDMFLKKYRGQ